MVGRAGDEGPVVKTKTVLVRTVFRGENQHVQRAVVHTPTARCQ